jgi:hypothetical protein
MTVPAISWAVGFRPFMYAIWAAGTRDAAARPLSVSPGRTLYAPMASGAPCDGAGAAAVTGALPGTGSFSVVPEMTHESSFSPLAEASVLSPTPWRAAMALSESPGCTR